MLLKVKQVELARVYYNELSNIAKMDNLSQMHVMFAQRCLSEFGSAFDAPDTYASSYRMCNRCFAVGKKTPRTYGKCVHCEAFYVCSQVCADAENGLKAHLLICAKAPDVIFPGETVCRRCRSTANLQASGCCGRLRYCSADCCKADWPRHRKVCEGKKK